MRKMEQHSCQHALTYHQLPDGRSKQLRFLQGCNAGPDHSRREAAEKNCETWHAPRFCRHLLAYTALAPMSPQERLSRVSTSRCKALPDSTRCIPLLEDEEDEDMDDDHEEAGDLLPPTRPPREGSAFFSMLNHSARPAIRTPPMSSFPSLAALAANSTHL